MMATADGAIGEKVYYGTPKGSVMCTVRAPYDAMAVEECEAAMAEPIVSLSKFTPVASMLNSVFQGPNITGTPAPLSFPYYPWGGRCGRA